MRFLVKRWHKATGMSSSTSCGVNKNGAGEISGKQDTSGFTSARENVSVRSDAPCIFISTLRGERLAVSSPGQRGHVQRTWKWRRSLDRQGEKWTWIPQIGRLLHTTQVQLTTTVNNNCYPLTLESIQLVNELGEITVQVAYFFKPFAFLKWRKYTNSINGMKWRIWRCFFSPVSLLTEEM